MNQHFNSAPTDTGSPVPEKELQWVHRGLNHSLQETVFEQTCPTNRLQRTWVCVGDRLEGLPPFWTAFALTLTEIVGGGVLALPIALAHVGPLAGVVLLIVFGLVNVLTIAFMAEAITRSGAIRYDNAFLGRMVADYLGRSAALILAVGLFIICALVLLAFYIGFATTLADATSIPAPLWIGVLFLIGLYFVRRESLKATVTSALVIGAINLVLILILTLLAFSQVTTENLLHMNVPFIDGQPFDPSLLYLVFGVILAVFFGHLSVSNCAQDVLQRDPSGRSLIWGAVAAQLTALVIYCIWVVAVNGAIAPEVLARESGTALIPLAAQVGPVVYLFGTIFVILAMGMASIHFSLGLFNLTREWLPTSPLTIASLKGQGRSPSNAWGSIQTAIGAIAYRTDQVILGHQGRFCLSISPVVAIFLLTEWLVLTGSESFTGPLSFLGVIVSSLLAGMFPVLLLQASRRKGDVSPGVVYRFLGHPVLLTSIYLLSLANLLLHGLIIWEDPMPRLVALTVGGLMAGLTVLMIRRGVFGRRTVILPRADQNAYEQSTFATITAGQPAIAEVT
jgi:amino acid permease